MTKTRETLAALAAEHTARFQEDATPATTRQIGFLAAIIDNNRIDVQEVVEAIEDYNGGHAWGLDKECAAMLIAGYVTPADMKRRSEIINRR